MCMGTSVKHVRACVCVCVPVPVSVSVFVYVSVSMSVSVRVSIYALQKIIFVVAAFLSTRCSDKKG